MRTNLTVPFAEKDRAKKLGARWNPASKVWYVENVEDIGAFAEWMPGKPAQKAVRSEIQSQTGRSVQAREAKEYSVGKPSDAITGNKTITLVCDCLPWLGCKKCQPILEAMGWGAKL